MWITASDWRCLARFPELAEVTDLPSWGFPSQPTARPAVSGVSEKAGTR